MLNFDGSNVNFFIAFIAGIVTFFASCLLPLVPTYLAYLSGIALNKDSKLDLKSKYLLVANGLLFTIGFVVVFVVLGVSAHKLASFLVINKTFIQRIGGMFLLVLGFFLLDITDFGFLNREMRLYFKFSNPKFQYLNSFLFGLTFGFAWTPCIGPVLAVILFWASQVDTALYGASLLFVYGLGLGFPFLLIAFLFEKLSSKLHLISSKAKLVKKVAGVIIILMGILLLIGKLDIVSIQLLNALNLSSLSV